MQSCMMVMSHEFSQNFSKDKIRTRKMQHLI